MPNFKKNPNATGSPMYKMKEFSGFGNSPLMDKKPHTGVNPPHPSHKTNTKNKGTKTKSITSKAVDAIIDTGKTMGNIFLGGPLYAGYKALTQNKKTKVKSPVTPNAGKLKETPGYADTTPFKPIKGVKLWAKKVEGKRIKVKKKKTAPKKTISLKPIKETIKTKKPPTTLPTSGGGALFAGNK